MLILALNTSSEQWSCKKYNINRKYLSGLDRRVGGRESRESEPESRASEPESRASGLERTTSGLERIASGFECRPSGLESRATATHQIRVVALSRIGKQRKMRHNVRNAPSTKTENQPVHPCSLIRVFIVRMRNVASFCYSDVPSEGSEQTARMPKIRFQTIGWMAFSFNAFIPHNFQFLAVCLPHISHVNQDSV